MADDRGPSPLCPEWYEPHARSASLTHTCDRESGHDGLHHCPMCGSPWVRHDPAAKGSYQPNSEEE